MVSINLEILNLLELVDVYVSLLQSVLFQQRFGVISCVSYMLTCHGLTLFGLELNQLHLVDRNGTLAVDPLVVDEVLVLIFHHDRDTLNGAVRHKPKASGLVGLFVFEDDAVFQNAEVTKVVSELVDRQVVRKTSHEYLSVLRVIHVNGLLDLINLLLQFVVLI